MPPPAPTGDAYPAGHAAPSQGVSHTTAGALGSVVGATRISSETAPALPPKSLAWAVTVTSDSSVMTSGGTMISAVRNNVALPGTLVATSGAGKMSVRSTVTLTACTAVSASRALNSR